MKRVQEMPWQLLQQINIHFCVKLGWTFEEVKHGLETCYANQPILSDRSIHRWISQFRGGRQLIVDKPRGARTCSGHSRCNIHKIEDLVAADRRVTICEMSLKSGLFLNYPTDTEEGLKIEEEVCKLCACSVD